MNDYVTIKWTVGDVQAVRPDLSNEQALLVLQHVVRHHDADIGVNWQVIELTAELVWGRA